MWAVSAFSREIAAPTSSSPLDGMPTLRRVSQWIDVAKARPIALISYSASHFQAVFVRHSLWLSDCFFLVAANVSPMNRV
jgi:hypothetical protein